MLRLKKKRTIGQIIRNVRDSLKVSESEWSRGGGGGGGEIEAVERNFPDVPGRNPSLQSRLAIKRLLED